MARGHDRFGKLEEFPPTVRGVLSASLLGPEPLPSHFCLSSARHRKATQGIVVE